MKIQILDSSGEKSGEKSTEIFDGKIRKDIMQKVIETEKKKQPFAPFILAGKQASASGKIRHGRRRWKTAAGRGLARIPRKIFWRRGTQFYWQGATVSSARGGRRSHPPKVLSMINTKKINKKEKKIAFLSALAMTASKNSVKERYSSLSNKDIKIIFPLVANSKLLSLKTKDFLSFLKNTLNDLYDLGLQKKSVRAGKGKLRGRKYKKTAGLLLIIGNKENKKIKGIDVRRVNQLVISDITSGDIKGARIVVYTEQAIADLENKIKGNSK